MFLKLQYATAARTAPGPRAGFSTIFRPRSDGVTGYVTSSHGAATPLRYGVTESARAVEAGNRVAPLQQWSRRSDLEKGVVEEQADGLSLLIVVGAGGILVAAFHHRL
jgi:hypothetical protein